jgi:hypothetical protein
MCLGFHYSLVSLALFAILFSFYNYLFLHSILR